MKTRGYEQRTSDGPQNMYVRLRINIEQKIKKRQNIRKVVLVSQNSFS